MQKLVAGLFLQNAPRYLYRPVKKNLRTNHPWAVRRNRVCHSRGIIGGIFLAVPSERFPQSAADARPLVARGRDDRVGRRTTRSSRQRRVAAVRRSPPPPSSHRRLEKSFFCLHSESPAAVVFARVVPPCPSPYRRCCRTPNGWLPNSRTTTTRRTRFCRRPSSCTRKSTP